MNIRRHQDLPVPRPESDTDNQNRGIAKFVTLNAKTDSMARTRQDLRDDKIGPDQDGSDVPPTPTKSFQDATRSPSFTKEQSRRDRTPDPDLETDPEPP